jgi:ADP-ribosylglycohydrolase
MRAAILGVAFAADPEARRALVRAATEITHRDPRALYLAQAIADLAALWSQGEVAVARGLACLRAVTADDGWQT